MLFVLMECFEWFCMLAFSVQRHYLTKNLEKTLGGPRIPQDVRRASENWCYSNCCAKRLAGPYSRVVQPRNLLRLGILATAGTKSKPSAGPFGCSCFHFEIENLRKLLQCTKLQGKSVSFTSLFFSHLPWRCLCDFRRMCNGSIGCALHG